jgi:V/A-type H+-transporting ATPase subunit C
MVDHGYLYARLRGMKSHLLTGQDYQRLVAAPGLKEVMEILNGTPLKSSLETALIRYQGIQALEAAVLGDYAEACRTVLRSSRGEERVLVGILLGRWDVFNVKTLLRARGGTGSPADPGPSLVPAGELDHTALAELARQQDARGISDLLATWGSPLADPLVENLDAALAERSTLRLELALDRWYFARAGKETAKPGRDRRLVGEALRREIDVVNIMAKVRLVLDELDTPPESGEPPPAPAAPGRPLPADRRARGPTTLPRARAPRPWQEGRGGPRDRPAPPPLASFFIPGGAETGGDRLKDLLRCHSMGDLIRFIASTSLGRHLDARMRELETIPDPATFQRDLERDLALWSIRLYRREPPNMAMAVSYLALRLVQLVNLRILCRGKEFGMPPEVLAQELVDAY